MKKITFLITVLVAFLYACNSGTPKAGVAKITEEQYLQQIDSMEKLLFAHPEAGFNKDAAQKTVNLYANIVKDYPSTKLANDYLYKAGEISSSLNNSMEAIAFFKKVYETDPGYEKAAYCLFLQAFIYENQLHQLGEAEQLYREVIKKFPNDRIAIDAEACIANLGKSDEELIKEFEAKNKKSS
jgi:tetratricopeptide (TPR) repeat protein